ncbi:TetR family transcriptional regulator [Streptomyces purpurogeneiscleroticus]|nr:TetR family transcriptional regulator [Streptomyces purpurogeneiscleroticus]
MSNTRERLLEAALELFAEKGFEATSLREIGAKVGVQNSAIYAHFDSKKQIFEFLMDSAGLLDLGLLGFETGTLAHTRPEEALPALAQKIMAGFDTPAARMFASVMMREGLFGAATGARTLAGSIAEVQEQFHEPFRQWAKNGWLRTDFEPEHLVWELLAPLANARFVYLHAQATPEDRRKGHEWARKHVDFFVKCCVLP